MENDNIIPGIEPEQNDPVTPEVAEVPEVAEAAEAIESVAEEAETVASEAEVVPAEETTAEESAVEEAPIEEISAEYLKGLSFHYVTDIQDVLDVALLQEEVKNPIKFTFEEERKEK